MKGHEETHMLGRVEAVGRCWNASRALPPRKCQVTSLKHVLSKKSISIAALITSIVMCGHVFLNTEPIKESFDKKKSKSAREVVKAFWNTFQHTTARLQQLPSSWRPQLAKTTGHFHLPGVPWVASRNGKASADGMTIPLSLI